MKASELSKKDIRRLKKLKAMAEEPVKLGESSVMLSMDGGDIAGIEDDLKAMEIHGVLDA